MSREHDFEPVRGLPGELPAGERLIWQGAPKWTRLACQAFHVRAVAAYFALMLSARAASAIAGGTAPDAAIAASLSVAPLAAAGVAILCGLAWLNARTTVYTLTSKRVVLRFGVALPKAINLPLKIIETGALKRFADGSGDVALALKTPNKVAFLHLWPHARPWKVASPQPTFRALADAAPVAALLAQAMRAEVGVEVAAAPLAAPVREAQGLARPEAAAA